MHIGKHSFLAAVAAILATATAQAQNKVQVFVLAGQSNMQGHGWHDDRTSNGIDEDGTLRKFVENDPNGDYDDLQDGSGNWITRSDVHIFTTDGNRSGGLTVGYGVDSTKFGPELGFGRQIGDAFTEDVLIIKTCWGGKSLQTDFRPPTAVQKRGGEVGFYYNEILNTVSTVLGSIGTYVPGYAGQGYELKGFGWHQGWNDRVNQSAVNEYEANMVDFINDIRFDLGAAELPFVVANTGIGGPGETNGRALALMQAQINVGNGALYPDFAGNVVSVETRSFWRDAGISPITSGNQGFHWNQNGETQFLIGDAMGTAMATMSSYVPFEQAYLEVNQQTGEIRIVNPPENLGAFEFEAYSITSPSGALDSAAWTPVTGNYDGNGNGSVDAGLWLISTATTAELAEAAVPGGTDGLVAVDGTVSLGAGAWIQNLTKDLSATYTDLEGIIRTLYVVHTGNENIAADLNFDGSINGVDWGIFINSAQADLSNLTGPAAYQLGDLDGDLDNDLRDYVLFRDAFELQNPAVGAFEATIRNLNP